MVNGRVKSWYSDRNFGFLTDKETNEFKDGIFFHRSQFPEGVEPITDMEVSYDIIETDRGLKADNIVILHD
jgi:cold shock CspA family protein